MKESNFRFSNNLPRVSLMRKGVDTIDRQHSYADDIPDPELIEKSNFLGGAKP